MKVLSWLFSIALLCHESYGIEITIPDLISSGGDIIKGVIEHIPNQVPTPQEIFQLPKNLLFGLPITVISSAIDEVCSAALSEDAVNPRVTPNIEEMQLQLHTACEIEHFPLLKAEELTKSLNFDIKKKVVIIVSGWLTDTSNEFISTLSKAYFCRGGFNVVVLDNAQFIRTLYTWSSLNTEEIGENLAKSLIDLTKVVPVENIQLIGHSLGAQIVGAAARYFQQDGGKNLTHITGLDPAKPCFNQGETLTGIYRGNADFVDILHSNPGIAGQSQALGDVDYYPGGLLPVKPGCLGITVFCSHQRAWHYYAESVYPNNVNNFLATRCTSLTHLREGRCDGEQQIMGFAVPHDLKGIYFSEVNAKEPYGPSTSDDFQSSTSACGACEES